DHRHPPRPPAGRDGRRADRRHRGEARRVRRDPHPRTARLRRLLQGPGADCPGDRSGGVAAHRRRGRLGRRTPEDRRPDERPDHHRQREEHRALVHREQAQVQPLHPGCGGDRRSPQVRGRAHPHRRGEREQVRAGSPAPVRHLRRAHPASRGAAPDRARGGRGEPHPLPGGIGEALRSPPPPLLRGGGGRHSHQEGEAPQHREALRRSRRIALPELIVDLVETYRAELRFARKPLARSLLIALLVLLAALPWWAPGSWLSRGSLVCLFAIGVVGQNLLIGYAGQISFGQAGFLAIGAYTFGHLRISGVPFPLALVAAGIAAGAAGWLVGFPSLRLKGPYLAIATLGFGTAVYQIFTNVSVLSGGHAGLALPALALPAGMSRDVYVYGLFFGLFLLFTAFAYNIVSSYVGRAFVAIRDSDIAAEAMGVNLARYKLLAFALSSFYTGVH